MPPRRRSGRSGTRRPTRGDTVRHALVEAAWVAVRAPGPLRAVYQRVRARRGAQVANVATARKMASLFWCLLTRRQDYAFGQPSLARQNIGKRELAAGAPSRKGQVRAADGSRNKRIREDERAVALRAESAYRQTLADWRGTEPTKAGASATPGRASQPSSKDKAARQTTSP